MSYNHEKYIKYQERKSELSMYMTQTHYKARFKGKNGAT